MNSPNVAPHINVHDFKKHYDAPSKPCFIDVREESEWQAARIPNALFIPKARLLSEPSKYLADVHDAIYLYCHSGVRSFYAAHALLARGYTNIYSIDGGILAWEAAGYPIES
jgi:rhodanese-related sulfurtransferase